MYSFKVLLGGLMAWLIRRVGSAWASLPSLRSLRETPPVRTGLDASLFDDEFLRDYPHKHHADLPPQSWGFLWFLVRRYFHKRALLMVLVAFLSMASMAVEPVALRHLVDFLGIHSGAAVWQASEVWWWLGVLIGMWLFSSLMNRAYQWLDLGFSPVLRNLVQQHLFSYLLNHSMGYFHSHLSGKLGHKIKAAGESCVQIMSIILHDLVRIVTILVVGFVLLLPLHPVFVWVMLLWVVLYLGMSFFVSIGCIRHARSFARENAYSSGRMIDAIHNVDVVRSFNQSDNERFLMAVSMVAEQRASKKFRRFLIRTQLLQHISTILFQATLILLVVWGISQGFASAGELVMIFSLSALIVGQLWHLSMRFNDFFEHTGALTETLHMVLQPVEIDLQEGGKKLQASGGEIALQHITFHYPGRRLFENFSLHIPAGQKVGLVGPSGSGKSTLVKLLRRQYALQAGSIAIDGQNIAEVSAASLNEAIAEVPQLSHLFHRPLAENIGYGLGLDAHHGKSRDKIQQAASDANAWQFIAALPEGLDSLAGEQGVRLSGGERQRVAIARALLKKSQILILDEATASLDSETEHQIGEALQRLFAQQTVIAIAHRLSTIRAMDRIIYMENGRVIEDGGFLELLSKNGAFAALWRRQEQGMALGA